MAAWKSETNFDKINSVLIISQDAEMVSVWEVLFQQKNCYVFSETNPREGVQSARLLTPTLIVLDLDMSQPERLTLCKELRSTTDGTLLLLAPSSGERDTFEYFYAGVDEHLSTPISPMGLLIKSMAWLARQEWGASQTHPERILS